MSASPSLASDEDLLYPDSDGQPMSDNTRQFRWIVTIQGNVDLLFADNPNVFVAGDLLWYPVQGEPTIRSAPDTMIVFERPKGDRGSYRQWRENNVAPQVVWEVLSPGNRRAELEEKLEFYQRYGVEEYYQYDPDRNMLRGWQRSGDQLVEIEGIADGWTSPRLGVRMRLGPDDLELYFPDGQKFRTFVELGQLREAAQKQMEAERREREAAQKQMEAERREREAAQKQMEAERREREAAQKQAERLAERLRALGIDPDAAE
ncbi:MAG: Uma2 family endonuclease [Gemmataceae bacterium]|nr:Uma2 family endonuclease [Gemmataceae bacterium]